MGTKRLFPRPLLVRTFVENYLLTRGWLQGYLVTKKSVCLHRPRNLFVDKDYAHFLRRTTESK